MTVAQESSAAPTAGVERVAKLLDAFDGRDSLTLAEITRVAGLSRSSTHRLLDQLVGLGWVRRHENTYELGMRIFEIGTLVMHQNHVHRTALPFLHDLHRATRLTVHFGILDGSDIVYLDRIGGLAATTLPSRIGARVPAHCTALGKALIAGTASWPMPKTLVARTSRTLDTPLALTRELAEVRRSGVAVERDEAVVGISCVAAAITGPANTPVAAISLCDRTASLRIDEVTAQVREAALRIGRTLTGPARSYTARRA
ncbi:IclR family transcriptional regulator [Nocardioides sp. W7]|uniref:IclR family transcriptional regulator n=1 Tax=Nocardioides sp. W7 TaxID=2931390 RepID=UPI001FD26843|nr:IclR family transcriptional regulator [Nocardioides sp. W7]